MSRRNGLLYVSPFEIFSNPIIRPLKQLFAHRCLSEWAVTTQQPQVEPHL